MREWGFSDPGVELIREARNNPAVRRIVEADVWDERSEDRPGPDERAADGRDNAASCPVY